MTILKARVLPTSKRYCIKLVKVGIPSGTNMDRVSRTIFTKSVTNMLSAFLPMNK